MGQMVLDWLAEQDKEGVGRARVLPALAWKHPGLPTTWTRVLERNPKAMSPDALPGHVRLGTRGKVLHVDEHLLKFTDEPPGQ